MSLPGLLETNTIGYQGEYFVERYGAPAAERTPPITRMLTMGVPVGAGTDATRVASYNPWIALYWLVTGKTVGGTSLYPEGNRLDRMEALRLYTVGSSWFSREEGTKGAIVPGQLADLAVLSADYFAVPEEQIKSLEAVLTIVGGTPVYGAGPFAPLAPPPPPVLPAWSPVATAGGTIAPPPVRCPRAPRGSRARPTGRRHPERAARGEAQGMVPSGGTVGVTALCSETLEVHDDDGSGAAPLLANSPSRARVGVVAVAVLVGVQPEPVRDPEPHRTRPDACTRCAPALPVAAL